MESRKKFYVFKLRGRWCAVQDTTKERAVDWAQMVRSNTSGVKYHDTQHEVFNAALASMCRAERRKMGLRFR